MAADNKSLGRFKLTGIPPAPRGIPQIQVSFDIDANGILQVTARDKTTGREQSITVQGTSTLPEMEVNRLIEEAAEFAQQDRERRERVEKRNRARALTDQAQRRLKEVTLDFGSQFTRSYRRQIDALSAEILDSLERDDDRRLDRAQTDLQDVLYELNREVRLEYEEEEGEGFFESIRRTFTGDREDDFSYPARRTVERDSDWSKRDRDYADGGNRQFSSPPSYSRNSETVRDYSRSPSPDRSRNSRSRLRDVPYENDWDEEDDDWF